MIIKHIKWAQAVAAATYGAELWGDSNLDVLDVVENSFLRGMLKIPQSSPLSF